MGGSKGHILWHIQRNDPAVTLHLSFNYLFEDSMGFPCGAQQRGSVCVCVYFTFICHIFSSLCICFVVVLLILLVSVHEMYILLHEKL